jgi:hypothetical protein
MVQYGLVDSPQHPPVIWLSLKDGLTYRLLPQHSDWNGLDVLVGVPQGSGSGALTLRVFSESGHLLRETSVDLTRVQNNDWLAFRFAPIANSHSQPYIVEFVPADRNVQGLIRFHESVPSEAKYLRVLWRIGHRMGVRLPRNSLYCRIWYANQD